MSVKSHLTFLYNGGLDPSNSNPLELSRRRIFSVFVMSLAPVACLLMATNFYFGFEADNLYIGSGTAVVLVGAYIQAYFNQRLFATHLVVFTYWSVVFFMFFDYGLIGTPIFWLFPIPPMAILLIGVRSGWIWCCISIASLFVVWFLEASSLLIVEDSFRTLINSTIESDSGLIFASDGAIILIVLTFATTVFKRSQALAESQLTNTVRSLKKEIGIRRLAEKKAIDSEQAKSVFLAAMGHELRTPLNGIIGASQILKDSTNKIEQEEFADVISNSGETLLELINNIMDISSLESGKLQLENRPINLQHLVKQTTSPFELQAKSKQLNLTYEISEHLPQFVQGDSTRLRQIIINLVGNAIKFTADGEVKVIIDKHNDELRIRIIDTGIGIPESALASLFEPYVQASIDTTRKYGGSGLGLAIVKKLTDAMSGSISVESEPGNGSCFTVTIPLKEGHEEVDAKPTTHSTALSKLKILVVDDNAVNRMVLARILEKDQHDVVSVTDGVQAVDYANSETVDLILMDIQMPNMDGLTATKQIRESKSLNSQTPIIAITANLAQVDREKAAESGMNGFIAKPFRHEELSAAILGCVEQDKLPN